MATSPARGTSRRGILGADDVQELIGEPEGTEIVLYCHSGVRSARAAAALGAAGYTLGTTASPGTWSHGTSGEAPPLARLDRAPLAEAVLSNTQGRRARRGVPRRTDAAGPGATDGRWALPGGWADVGESLAEAVVREVREESGYTTRAVKLLAVANLGRYQDGRPLRPNSTSSSSAASSCRRSRAS